MVRPTVNLMLGDCLERMAEIADRSIDAIICDLPYPEVNRAYGRMTEVEWDAMMRQLIPEYRRVALPGECRVPDESGMCPANQLAWPNWLCSIF